MAVLEKIRVRMGVFITIIIGVALVSFIIDANTLREVASMFSSQNDVGEINGRAISYEDFIQKENYYRQAQSLFTGETTSMSEEMQEQIRAQVWQDFFKEEVLYEQFRKSGVEVSDAELIDLAQGRNVSPVLAQDPLFWGENGEFSRAQLTDVLNAVRQNPAGNVATYWRYCEDRMRDAQLLAKYMGMLSQSSYLTALELKRRVDDRNTTIDIRYVAQPVGFMPDSAATGISEADARSYYKKHEKEFEQETSRDLELVAFPIKPSDEDIRLTEEKMTQIYQEFTGVAAGELDRFVSRNSDVSFTGRYHKRGELSARLDSFAFSATAKDILPVYRDEDTFYMARIIKSRMMPDSVRARHILLQESNKQLAGLRADTVLNLLRSGADFVYVAQQYSADQAANSQGGDLGWFRQGTMIKAFEDTCFVVPKNRFIKVETDFGWHVVEVTDRAPEERMVQLAVIEKTAIPGKVTYQAIFSEASNLSAASNNDRTQFKAAAQKSGYLLTPAYSIKEGQKTMASLPDANTRELASWAYEAKADEVSQVITLDNYFVVASLAAAREQGIAPFQQVKTDIEAVLQQEQRAEKVAQTVREAMNTAADIDAVADKLGNSAGMATDVSFTARSIAGIGMEPKLQGAVAGAAENTVVGPVKGAMAVYAFTVTRRYTGAAYTIEEEKMRERYGVMQRELYTFYDVMEKAAKVQDWRGRFF